MTTSHQKSQLTDPPTNLREAIDWLALVGGYGKNGSGMGIYIELGDALQKLQDFKDSTTKTFGKSYHPSSFIKNLVDKLGKGFLGYEAQGVYAFSGKGIVYGDPAMYKSTYYGASWEQSSVNDYAKIFLFLAVLIYYLITFLYWMCKSSDKWADKMVSDGGPLSKFFEAMGYRPQDEFKNGKSAKDVITALDGNAGSQGSDAFPELQAACGSGNSASSSYSNFLTTLEANGSGDALLCPLTACKRFSYAYLQSRYSGTDITAAIDTVKGTLVNLSASGHGSNTNDFSPLTNRIKTLLNKIQSFDPNSVPSPVAPLAGAVTTLTAAGGAGAAYGLNLFGFQGIVKALFGFK
ncbi:variant erythrocyte surface antigen-1 family protein [Babesia caballi]|uniref:Variant erythrocyte surface antigen-1 family protein n=1 Tax=Babesia caballi TaxID=5871 RepID=A0AAV4LT28_BABCB|nr:variant erythrocyte surface antigen-1 family protein [Babesia caballi]